VTTLASESCRCQWLSQLELVCLRDGKEAVEQPRAIYPDEAKNAELDIMPKFKAR
jgi:hypothetical protein